MGPAAAGLDDRDLVAQRAGIQNSIHNTETRRETGQHDLPHSGLPQQGVQADGGPDKVVRVHPDRHSECGSSEDDRSCSESIAPAL